MGGSTIVVGGTFSTGGMHHTPAQETAAAVATRTMDWIGSQSVSDRVLVSASSCEPARQILCSCIGNLRRSQFAEGFLSQYYGSHLLHRLLWQQ